MKSMTKPEQAALILELRTLYEQSYADNVRLRAAHDAQCAMIDELEATIRDRMATESAPTAARGVASPMVDESARDDALSDLMAGRNPTIYVEENEFRMDTLKRIRIKYRCTTRFNREVRAYEIYRDGAWMLAPR